MVGRYDPYYCPPAEDITPYSGMKYLDVFEQVQGSIGKWTHKFYRCCFWVDAAMPSRPLLFVHTGFLDEGGGEDTELWEKKKP